MPIWAVDIDGLEPFSTQEIERFKEQAAVLGFNTVILSAGEQIHKSYTNPKPLREVTFAQVNRQVFKSEYISDFSVSDHIVKLDLPIAKEDINHTPVLVINEYRNVWNAWFERDAKGKISQYQVDAVSLFSPSIFGSLFKGGKYSKGFLDDAARIIPGSGVPKFQRATPTTGFNGNSKIRQDFTSAFDALKNNINKHLDDGEMSGLIKEMHGKSSNGQHLFEATGALNGLKNSLKTLQRMVDRDQLKGDALDAGLDAIQAARHAVQRVTDVMGSAARSVKNHTKDGTL